MARHGWQGSTGEYDETFVCAQCGNVWRRPTQGSRAPKYCSDACKQKAYRERRAAAASSRTSGAGRASGASSGTGRSGSTGGRGGAYGQGSSSSSSWSGGYGAGGRGGSGSSSSSSSGASGGRSTSAGNGRSDFHARHMSTGDARRTIFRIAGLADDGLNSVKKAYRSASRKLHPDHGATPEQAELFKLLSLAKSILEKAGLYV